MLKNSPSQLSLGDNTGGKAAVALRTAFGNIEYIYNAAFGGLNVYNLGFPEDDTGGILSLDDPITFNPISRIIAGGFSNNRPVQVVVLP
jgi:hypothetical protein